MFKNVSLVTVATLLATQGAFAQDSTGSGSLKLDPVVVEADTPDIEDDVFGAGRAARDRSSVVATQSTVGTKTGTPLLDTPASVSVVTQKEMRQRGVENLDEAMAYTAGVLPDVYGSDNRYDHFMVRGFYQTGLGTYRDGLAMRNPGFTGNRMEPYGMERIEVLKGSTSTLFGLNGPGGLVNGVTKKPLDEEFGEIYTTLGDAHYEAGTDFGAPVGDDGKWFYRITTKGQKSEDGTEYSDDDRFYLAPSLTWRPTAATELTLLTDFSRREGNTSHGIPVGSGLDPDSYLGEPDFDNMDTEEWNLGYQFSHRFSNDLQFRQNVRYSDLDLTYESVYGATTDPTVARSAWAVYGDTQRFAIDNQLQYDTSVSFIDSRTLAGVDYYYQTVDEERVFGSASGIDVYNPVFCGPSCITLPPGYTWEQEQSALGLYLQEEATFADRLIVTLGGRYDTVDTDSEYPTYGLSYSDSDDAFTTRAGVTYKLRQDLSVYANYSESFEPVSSETGLAGSPKPKEGTQYEIGVKFAPAALDDALFSLALFDLTQSNVPYYVNATTQEQIGEVNVRGVEFEGKVALTDRLDGTLAYSYWDASIEEDGVNGNVGNRPQLVPNHIGSAWLNYTIPGGQSFNDVSIGGGVRYVGSTYADNANTIEIDSRTTFDAAIGYQLTEQASLQLNATNIFDERDITSIDTYSNTAYYADGRTVKATLRYTW